MTSLLKTACASALLLASAFASAEAETLLAGNFSKGLDGWTFYNGREFPGAEGNLWFDEKGKRAAMEGFFKNGGSYVAMSKNFATPFPVKTALVKLEARNLKGVVLRFTDSTGQVFQQMVPLKASEAGEAVALRIENVAAGDRRNFWGGAKDGKWHGPAKAMSLIIDRGDLLDAPRGKAQAFIETIELRDGAQ